MKMLADSTHIETDEQLGLERMIFFSDAVFAIAITLLAIDIRIPRDTDPAFLTSAITHLIPNMLVYGLAFIQIALFWVAHHRLFRYIKRYDDNLLWLNILFLMFVAFLPVPSAALGEYGAEKSVVIFFASCFVIITLIEILIWHYAVYQCRLVAENLDKQLIRYITMRTLIVTGVFTISIVLAFWNPLIAMLSWLSIFLFQMNLSRWHSRKMSLKNHPQNLLHGA